MKGEKERGNGEIGEQKELEWRRKEVRVPKPLRKRGRKKENEGRKWKDLKREKVKKREMRRVEERG